MRMHNLQWLLGFPELGHLLNFANVVTKVAIAGGGCLKDRILKRDFPAASLLLHLP